MNCENCNNEHSGKYGSGRFCSSKCARGFSTKSKRQEINEKVSVKMSGRSGSWNKGLIFKKKYNNICKCGKTFHRNRKYCSFECACKYVDYSAANRRAYKNGRNVSGGRCKYYDYGEVKVQGTYELRMCKVLDKMKELNDIKSWEYTRDRIKYIAEDGLEHAYLLDFKVINNDGSIKYIETKGFVQERDGYKWKTCKQKNIHLEVIFKKDLSDLEDKYIRV